MGLPGEGGGRGGDGDGGGGRERAENLFKKITAEKDSNLDRDIFIQLHEAYRCPNRFNPEKTSLRHVIIKLSKIQGRGILTAAREKELAAYGELP